MRLLFLHLLLVEGEGGGEEGRGGRRRGREEGRTGRRGGERTRIEGKGE